MSNPSLGEIIRKNNYSIVFIGVNILEKNPCKKERKSKSHLAYEKKKKKTKKQPKIAYKAYLLFVDFF